MTNKDTLFGQILAKTEVHEKYIIEIKDMLKEQKQELKEIVQGMSDNIKTHTKMDEAWQQKIEAEIQGHNDIIKIGKFLMKYLFPALGILYPIIIFYIQMTVIFKIDPSKILQTLLSLNYEDLFILLQT